MTRKGGHQIFVSNRISMHIKQLQRTSKGVDVFMSSDVRSRAQFVRCTMYDGWIIIIHLFQEVR